MNLAQAKLESSGLDLDDARELGIDFLSGEQSNVLMPAHGELAALRLNYYDPITRDPMVDWPKAPPFFRLRYLEEDSTSFATMTDKKALRYVQPGGTAPVAYYPLNMDWGDVLPDAGVPLIVTEGELKAAKACKEGFPTIGLGGVDSFQAKKMGVVWLASLEIVEWVGRYVYICFDSDMRSNPNVLGALERLAEELEARGAHPHVVSLPDLSGPDIKVGLDDFLIHDDGGAEQFATLLHEAEPLGLSRALFNINERYVYVADPGLVVNEKTGAKTSPGAFKEHVAAPQTYVTREFDSEGNIRTKTTSAAGAWLRWPLRRQVDRITYAPGKERFIFNGVGMLNEWRGWGCAPKKGDVSMFLDLIDHLFSGSETTDPGAKEWFIKWLAYPLQHPGTKLYSSSVIVGRRHGTGKSLVAYTMGNVYGSNFVEIKQRDLHADHNEWAQNKQFVLADDVTGSKNRDDADLLKNMITARTLRINIKYVPSYEVPDVINYYFTSNRLDAFFLDDDDRRFFIWEVHVGPLYEEFYVAYDLWLASGGAQCVFEYLVNDVDLSDFNPAAPAFVTSAKTRMINDVQSDLGSWVRRLIDDPDSILKVGAIHFRQDVFTNTELLNLYDPERRTGTTANGLGRELRRAGMEQVNAGRPIKGHEGSQRYYAVRNETKWLHASPDDIVRHLTDAGKAPSKKY